ncbi:hypothetical protein Aph01nite_77410 [Acrocarpospora phusangensis]|uniref:Dynamin family protein n=1 Tax=Acrocarpospora phusangensis TaxID=1070424 RepID=A0A919UPA5_9ACTN|nr:dynamin family protein [Acrocarpospora phusangensis]GIH29431.1 hypothetical protein Aph01nite_77410 [Acrocarpospora phusangensis]
MANTENVSELAERIKAGVDQAKSSATRAIDDLAGIAESLAMRETSDRLRETGRQLRSDTFNIIVMGRFKNGKSTLLNALMGGTTVPVDLQGHKGPMVVDDLPATAILTGVQYADPPFVKAWGFDSKAEEWTFSRYLQESSLYYDEEENIKRFAHIRQFEMGFPATLCQAGVIVYDSPGLDENPTRSAVTRDATGRCDAAIVVYRSDSPMGMSELDEVSRVVADGTRVFSVVNLMHGKKADEKLKGFFWNKYVRDHQQGPSWTGQDLATRGIYFVDANQARDGRYTGDQRMIEASGLLEFEKRLAAFLNEERLHEHLKKYATQASTMAATVEQQIAQRRQATQADQARLREAYTSILPSLTAIKDRPAKIPRLFKRHRARAESELIASFTALVSRIRAELAGHLESVEISRSLIAVLRQEKMKREVSDAINLFVAARIEEWGRTEAGAILRSVLEELGEDLENEIATIGRQFDEIHLELTGWKVEAGSGSIVGTTDRVLGAVAGLLFGNVGAVVGGGAGGWRGALGGAVGAAGAWLAIGALGVTAAPVVITVVLLSAAVASIVGGNLGLAERAKRAVRKVADDQLRLMPEEKSAAIARELAERFDAMEATATSEISALIDEEERNIQEIVSINQREQGEKDQILADLDRSATALAACQLELKRALTIAQQR